ncbi:30S ribosomal protein S1 [Nitratidesulfovibrio sp. HK-II]|uniref:30S ribosomal protein S1 n=1 Tax=Nitratidesulfovibrio sp. HK-II TaxID=2009266 RepID=UPI000E2FCFF5|nr:30S ribosomal protein S1 [Nitratidesulfovibrio sp. HK-II]GBO95999.1 SSU ribosomal protein S1p [Nitratidesulfovibrio sp. HK-II]
MTGERTEGTGLESPEATPETAQAEAPAHEAAAAPAPQEAAPVDMSGDDAFDENASFADLLEAHSGTAETVRTGERVKATVVAIGEDTVFVATGAKVDGIVERKELEDAEGNLPLAVGDVLELYVVSANANEIKLSRAMTGQAGLAQLEDARSGGIPVEGRVTGPCKGGFNVEVLKRRAFCPASQMDLRPGAEPDSFTGQTFQFLVTRLEQNGRNIVVSRRMLLEREQAESLSALMQSVNEGDVLEGTVARLAPFGAFVEIAPGLEGMVHVSELSWSRVQQADEAVSVGDKVRVKVLGISGAEEGKGGKDSRKGPRISLSIRQVSGDPWQDVADRLDADQVLTGKVTRLAPFGAFIEVLPGVEGLVHLSEMSWTRRINKPEEAVTPGETVTVKVKELDPARKRLSLSLRDAEGDPWSTAEERFPAGSTVTGTVEKRAPFGLFVNLAPGVTGLLPNAVAATSPQSKTYANMNPGAEVSLVVRDIDVKARRISLAPADATGEDDGEWRKYGQPQKREHHGGREGGREGGRGQRSSAPTTVVAGDSGGFGILGNALQAALEKRKK